MTSSAVVFGYGDVGLRCTRVLLKHGIDVQLIVTHEDDPRETRWYASLAEFAGSNGLSAIAPAKADDKLLYRLHSLRPDFVFSFYYRQLLPEALLKSARVGALNMHGSLLPRFRGRAPVNWAVLRGASETGATLHHMVARADAGDIVDQQSVPIGENDTAYDVFLRVAAAAEAVFDRSLPRLIAGTAPRKVQDLSLGEYCGRRRPEDGRIDWSNSAREIHDLVRAVAPPFPGAFAYFNGEKWLISRSRVLPARGDSPSAMFLRTESGHCVVNCVDGQRLAILEARDAHGPIDLQRVGAQLEQFPVQVG